jgi:hypothetical protein
MNGIIAAASAAGQWRAGFLRPRFRDQLTGKPKRILTARVLQAKPLLRLNTREGRRDERRNHEESHELFADRGIGRHIHPAVSGLRDGQADHHHRRDQFKEVARHRQSGSDHYPEGNHGRGRQVQQRMVRNFHRWSNGYVIARNLGLASAPRPRPAPQVYDEEVEEVGPPVYGPRVYAGPPAYYGYRPYYGYGPYYGYYGGWGYRGWGWRW